MKEYGSRHKCCIIAYIQGILGSIHTHTHSVCVYADMCISSEDTSQLCLSKWCLLWKWTICFTALLFLRSAVWQFSTCNVTSSPPPPDELQYVTGSSHQLYVVSVSRNPISVQSESAAVLELDLSLRLTEHVIWCRKNHRRVFATWLWNGQQPFNRSFYKSVFTYIDATFVAFAWLFQGWRKPLHFKLFFWEFWLWTYYCLHAILGLICHMLISFAYQICNMHIIFTFNFGI